MPIPIVSMLPMTHGAIEVECRKKQHVSKVSQLGNRIVPVPAPGFQTENSVPKLSTPICKTNTFHYKT